jgi:hypothetical protein
MLVGVSCSRTGVPDQVEVSPTAVGGGPSSAESCAVGQGPLDATVAKAVERVLADERRAEAHYATMTEQFGDDAFREPDRAGRTRSARLEALLVAHDRSIPSTAAGPEQSYLSTGAGCADGVAIERALLGSYDDALGETLPADVKCVLGQLRTTVLQEHLPHWLTCAPMP